MTTKVRMTLASVLLAAALGFLCASGSVSLAGEGVDKAVAAEFSKLGDAIKKGDKAEEKKLATKIVGMKQLEDYSDLMHLFKPRGKGGLGWGPKAGSNPASDGLEKKIQDWAKNGPKANDVADANNEDAAAWLIGMADVIKTKGWTGGMGGGKTKKAWDEFAEQNRTAAAAFAKAVASKNAANIKSAANELNNSCLNCHSKFK